MSKVVPFPRREFRNSAEAALFAYERFHELAERRERATLSCDRKLMQSVIEGYERDIIPYSPHYNEHLAVDLRNFGEWLRDVTLIERAIWILKDAPLYTHRLSEPAAQAHRSSALGYCLLARSDFDASRLLLDESICSFRKAIGNPKIFSGYDLCRALVGLGLAHLSRAELSGNIKDLEAVGAAFDRATPLHDMDSLDWARQRGGQVRMKLLAGRLQGGRDLTGVLAPIDEAISIYRGWPHAYVIPPVWIERLELLRVSLVELGASC